MVRRERGLPDDKIEPGGVMILRNPGVALVYSSRDFSTFRVPNGILWDMGTAQPPLRWFAEGRPATVGEIMRSIETGMPLLAEVAKNEGSEAMAELEDRRLKLEQQIANEALV